MKNNYVIIKVTGKNISLFIKKLIINNVFFKDVKKINNNEVMLTIKYQDYILVRSIKTIYNITIVKYKGLLKYYNFIINNTSFVISFTISFVILILLSNICFDIDIIHSDKNLRNLIKEELSNNKIKKYNFIPNFKKRKEIIELIMNNNKSKIEWLEIERKGVKLIVKLTERKENQITDEKQIRDIVASKEGIIKMIENKAGVSTKKVNDYVKQGDVIITGNIIKDETIKKQVPAEGIVFAEVWYNAYVEYPLYYEEIMYLDNVNNNLTISFFDKKISILKNYDNSYIMKSKTLYKNNILPFKISLDKMRKIKIVKNKLSKDEALNKAMMLAESKLSKKLNKQEYIISKNTLNFTSSSSKIKVDVFFKVYENITEYRNIEIVDPLETQN